MREFEELKALMRERKPVHIKRNMRKKLKKRKRTNYVKRKALIVDHVYYSKRVEDFLYYIDRSGLTCAQITRSVGIPYDWLAQVYNGRIKRPNEHRVSTIIDFLKDFERLETFYAAVIK